MNVNQKKSEAGQVVFPGTEIEKELFLIRKFPV